MKHRAHIFVSGRVHGVFFRDFTQRSATSLGLVGWVRNLRDGRVEAVAQGDEPNVSRLIELLRRGPPAARVDDLEVSWEPPDERLSGFEVRY